MIKFAGMAFEISFDLAQTACAGQLRIQHRNHVGLGLERTGVMVGVVLCDQSLEKRPRNLLQNPMKNDILVLHGVDLLSSPIDSQATGNE